MGASCRRFESDHPDHFSMKGYNKMKEEQDFSLERLDELIVECEQNVHDYDVFLHSMLEDGEE